MRQVLLTLAILATIFAAPVAAQPGVPYRDITVDEMRGERRVALVVGNGAYADAPLRNPVNDARAVAQMLRELGFTVLEYENADHRAMRRGITTFGEHLRGGGVGLFYFSGHGVQIAGRNYLLPIRSEITTEGDVEVEGIDVALVLARMEGARNRLNIVVLDACRDNPFERRFRAVSKGLASIDAPSGTIIAYATAPGRVARDGDGTNGLYTGELLKTVRVPGLKIEDVFKRVRQVVQQQTRWEQVPWESSSLVGDFMFALPKVASMSAPESIPAPPAARPEKIVAVAPASRPSPASTAMPAPQSQLFAGTWAGYLESTSGILVVGGVTHGEVRVTLKERAGAITGLLVGPGIRGEITGRRHGNEFSGRLSGTTGQGLGSVAFDGKIVGERLEATLESSPVTLERIAADR